MNYNCVVLLCVTVFLTGGCAVGYHHTETIIHSDGSISRSVLQPQNHTPESAREAVLWDQVTTAVGVSFEELVQPINTLPVRHVDDVQPYFAAWKTCKPGEALPEHFRKSGPDPQVTSTFNRDFVRRDLGFVISYAWDETLTDVVRLEDMRVARQELMTILLNLAEYTLSEGLPDAYTSSQLVAWMRTDGSRWFVELTDALHDTALQARGDELQALFGPRMAEISQRYGLTDMFKGDGKTFTLQSDRIEQFAQALIQRTVTTRDGRPISRETATEILTGFLAKTDETKQGTMTSRLNEACERGIENYPGGREAFELKLAKLATRIWGVHCVFLGSSLEKFQFTLDLPGVIVEADGVLLSDSKVQWQFSASNAYPAGYRMHVQSLDDRTVDIPGTDSGGVQRKPLTRGELLEIVKRLHADETLLAVARECQAARTFAPLLEHSEKLGKDPESAEQAAIARKLLRTVSRK